MADQSLPAVIIENGSYECKLGFSGDDWLDCIPTVIGEPKFQFMGSSEYHVGCEALDRSFILNLKYPIQNGIIDNWDGINYSQNYITDMERIYHYMYNKLRVKSDDRPLLIIESRENPQEKRQKTIKIMFETFNVPQLQIAQSTLLSLFFSGRTTGIVVDSGYGATNIQPIFEGHPLLEGNQTIPLAGKACTDWLIQILRDQGGIFTSNIEKRKFFTDIKAKLCYVTSDFLEERIQYQISSVKHKIYELPDGNQIAIQDQRFRCPELLFQPKLYGLAECGIHELLFKSIKQCDMELRKEFYGNIVLSGGTTMFTGLRERLSKEMIFLSPQGMKIQVNAPPDRKFSGWLGGSIWSSYFQNDWITKAEYDEAGPSVVHRVWSP